MFYAFLSVHVRLVETTKVLHCAVLRNGLYSSSEIVLSWGQASIWYCVVLCIAVCSLLICYDDQFDYW